MLCAEWASTKDLKVLKAQIKAGLLSRSTPAPVPTPFPTPVPTTLPPTVGAGALPVAPVLTVVPGAPVLTVVLVAPAVPAAAIGASETVALNITTATAPTILPVPACAPAPTTTVTPATPDETALAAPVAVAVAVAVEDAGNYDAALPSPLLNAATSGECPGAVLLVTPEDTNRTACNANADEDADAAGFPASTATV